MCYSNLQDARRPLLPLWKLVVGKESVGQTGDRSILTTTTATIDTHRHHRCLSQNQYGAQSLGATAHRGVCPRPHVGFFFHFLFSSFPLLTIFLIHKLGAQLILWNKLCTQLDIYRKSYVHNLSLKKYTHKLFFE
jgi:hypothetical protein